MNWWSAIGYGAVVVATSGGLTVLDLDKTFYVPRDVKKRRALRLLWWGFAAANGLAALVVYVNIRTIDPFRTWNPLLLSITVGAAYLAILRTKLTTFRFEGKDVPFGLEALYDAGRDYVFKRINIIARDARRDEALALSVSRQTKDLAQDAFNVIENDALTSEDEKQNSRRWLEEVLNEEVDERQRRLVLAIFILSGRRARTAKLHFRDDIAEV